MARCFLTGVEFRVEEGHVLHRSDAYRLLRMFRRRSESLERLITQFSPLDEPSAENMRLIKRKARKQHRMICKGVADALAQAYPEIELFLSWPELQTRNTMARMRALSGHPVYGESISGLPDEELASVARLARDVLRLIDPRRELPIAAQMAVRAGICIRHRTKGSAEILELIRSAISENGALVALGVPEEAHELVRAALMPMLCARNRDRYGRENE